MAGSSTSSFGEEYPYPIHAFVPTFVTVKLCDREMYGVWQTQMLCLLESHNMLGFINKSPPAENSGDYMSWRRSDALAKGWILGSLSQQILCSLVKTEENFTAKDAWDRLRTIFGPHVHQAVTGDLLHAKDFQGQTPLAGTFSNEHIDTRLYLLGPTSTSIGSDIEMANSINCDELLFNAISFKDYNSALVLVHKHSPSLQSKDMLMAITQNFPCKVNTWRRAVNGCLLLLYLCLTFCIFSNTPVFYLEWYTGSEDSLYVIDRLIFFGTSVFYALFSYKTWAYTRSINWWSHVLFYLTAFFVFPAALVACIGLFYHVMRVLTLHIRPVKERAQLHNDATELLKEVCKLIKRSVDSGSYVDYYNNAIFEATRSNASEVVETIVSYFPAAIRGVNEDGHDIIQCAVLNRSEKVYNLVYQMSEHKNIYRTIKDPLGNNLLHLTGRLAPPNKLNRISGAALQIQRELQWYKEVERFVGPLSLTQKNCFGETPQMVFTREHRELVIEGERWMKGTAQTCIIAAGLIITIMFAAAVTVPGGNEQGTGHPVFTNGQAFKVFAVSDVISLFTSLTSLLMFSSILTTRFAEKDFLFKLPAKLIIGLTTLFISTAAMLVAFGAAFFLVLGQDNSWILASMVALTLLPVTLYATLLFQLVVDLARSTYGDSVFGKQINDPFY